MALEGTLEDFSLADIFQLIGIQRKTGILTLKNADETVTVKFYNGMVVGADSHPKKIEDRLGRVLVKTGLITPDQLREVLERQQKTLQKIGFILVDQKHITREQLQEALHIQVSQMIYRLFRWGKGEYYFDQKAKVDPDSDDSIPPLSAESILMEGIQMIDEWPLIQKKIPNFEVVFRPIVHSDDLDMSEKSEEDRMLESLGLEGGGSDVVVVEKIRLNREESEVFKLLNGKNTVADVIESTRLGEFHSCKALYDLMERKIIEPVAAVRPATREQQIVFSAVPPLVAEHRVVNLRLFYAIITIVVAVLILFTASDPLRLAVKRFFYQSDATHLKSAISTLRLNILDSAIVMYYKTQGVLPDNLNELVERKYVRQEDTLDPWSRSYVYQRNDDGYVLAAYNQQGQIDPATQFHRDVPIAANQKEPTSELRLQ